jgi:DNA-binding transcriptional LysR family regulator
VNLKFLETFIWVARLHSFSLAADKLHSTQAAISSRISVLEQDLGTKLFTRDPKGVTLTREGERVLHYAEHIAETMEHLRASLRDETLASGSIRIGAMDSAVHAWFIDFVTDVTRTYPNLDVEVTVESALNLAEQLRRGMLDMVFQTDFLRDETIRSVELMRLPFGWVAAPHSRATLEASGKTRATTLRAIAGSRIITYSRHSRPHQDLMRLLQSHGINEARVSCVNSLAAIIKLAQDGFGVAVVPPALVPASLWDSELTRLDCPDLPAEMPFVAAWRFSVDNPWPQRLIEVATETVGKYVERVGADAAHIVV